MPIKIHPSVRNLSRKPGRTAALIILSLVLCFTVTAGSLIINGLRGGLVSLETRLGADIMVVPYQASTKADLKGMVLQGNPGYFYMDRSVTDKVSAMDGVGQISEQFFLATASASCCSYAVQIIGFEPETDFSIQPWIRESYSKDLGDGDIIVGSSITVPKNHILRFYNQDCNVVASLASTGTGLDTAVYANMNTIRSLMDSAHAQGYDYGEGIQADRAISAIMVKVKDGYSIENVTNDLSLHIRRAETTQARTMVSSIAGGLTNVSHIIGGLTAMIWILAIVILALAFAMIAHERTKEFAILRVLGASRGMVSGLLRWESALVSLIGAVAGAVIGALVVFPFSGVIRGSLDLPYLMPGAGTIAGLFIGSVAVAVLAGSLASALSARRISRNDTGLILREGA